MTPISLRGKSPSEKFYLTQAQPFSGPVLMLGAGGGHLLNHLALSGADICLVEDSANRMSELPTVSVETHIADFKTFDLPTRFPMVLACDNVMGLFRSPEELSTVLANISRHLLPSGKLVFDVNHPQVSRDSQSAGLRQKPVFVPHLEDKAERNTRAAIHRLRGPSFSVEMWEKSLKEAGLVPVERYSQFDGHPFDETSALLILVAVKD